VKNFRSGRELLSIMLFSRQEKRIWAPKTPILGTLNHKIQLHALARPVSVKIVVAFSYAALADVDEVFASAGGFNQTSPI